MGLPLGAIGFSSEGLNDVLELRRRGADVVLLDSRRLVVDVDNGSDTFRCCPAQRRKGHVSCPLLDASKVVRRQPSAARARLDDHSGRAHEGADVDADGRRAGRSIVAEAVRGASDRGAQFSCEVTGRLHGFSRGSFRGRRCGLSFERFTWFPAATSPRSCIAPVAPDCSNPSRFRQAACPQVRVATLPPRPTAPWTRSGSCSPRQGSGRNKPGGEPWRQLIPNGRETQPRFSGLQGPLCRTRCGHPRRATAAVHHRSITGPGTRPGALLRGLLVRRCKVWRAAPQSRRSENPSLRSR